MNACHIPPSIISSNPTNNIIANSFHPQLTSISSSSLPTATNISKLHEQHHNNNNNENHKNNNDQNQQCANNNLSISLSSKRTISEICSTNVSSKKKRKKNGLTHSKLLEEFAHRSHVRNNVNLLSYHGKKQNIKTLCPYHDMLPVIKAMEQEVFGQNDTDNEHHHNAIDQKSVCSMLPIIKNQSEWCCSGSLYKSECRNISFVAKKLYEYEFDFDDIAQPIMDAVVLGGPNPNICIKVNYDCDEKESTEGQFKVNFKPLQDLSLIDRNNTVNVALKAISCGTFKRNLQPVVCIQSMQIFLRYSDLYITAGCLQDYKVIGR